MRVGRRELREAGTSLFPEEKCAFLCLYQRGSFAVSIMLTREHKFLLSGYWSCRHYALWLEGDTRGKDSPFWRTNMAGDFRKFYSQINRERTYDKFSKIITLRKRMSTFQSEEVCLKFSQVEENIFEPKIPQGSKLGCGIDKLGKRYKVFFSLLITQPYVKEILLQKEEAQILRLVETQSNVSVAWCFSIGPASSSVNFFLCLDYHKAEKLFYNSLSNIRV